MYNKVNQIHKVDGYSKDAYTYYPIIIVGAGESGIAMGCRLKEVLGFDQFRIFDRQAGIGGTWWINRYPGVACDVPAIYYSFSFSPNNAWQSFHPEGPEILQYFHDVCAKYGLINNVQCNTDIKELRWLETEQLWEATLHHLVHGTGDMSRKARDALINEKGREAVIIGEERVRARIICSAAGGFVEPNPWPETIPGREKFEGDICHTARWNPNMNLKDKDVIVVGTGCSAAQVVPKLTKDPINAKSVTQIMRSPPWVVPRPVPPGGEEWWAENAPWILTNFPFLGPMFRLMIFSFAQKDWFDYFLQTPRAQAKRKLREKGLLEHMKNTAPETYWDILTPNYESACKRLIYDAFWLNCLQDPKIDLITKPLKRIETNGVVLGTKGAYPPEETVESKMETGEEQGEEHLSADAIILANGFEIQTWLAPTKIIGRYGKELQDVWDERGGPQAYMGNAIDGFPNFFIIFGPNTATGHDSVILASENMVEYTLKFIRYLLRGDVKTFEVKKEKEIAWAKDIQEKLKGTVFMSGCQNWYRSKTGWNATTYPYSQFDFGLKCMFPKWSDWDIHYTRKGIIRQRMKQALQIFTFTALLIGAYRIRKEPFAGLMAIPYALKGFLKSLLVRGLGLLE